MTHSQHQISRRLVLGGGLGGSLVGLTGLPAGADSPTSAPLTPAVAFEPELFGPASLTGAAMGASFQGDKVYVLSRYGNPTPLFGVFDLATAKMLNVVTVPSGTGGYTLASTDDHVYLGLTNDPHVWDYDVAAGTLSPVAAVGPASNWTYGLCLGPDGMIYAGTYPEGKVWRIDPATGATTDFGRVSTSNYARVAADETYVYGGSQSPARLVAYPLDGGAPIDLTSALPTLSGVTAMAARDGVLHVATSQSVVTITNQDPATAVVRSLPEKDRLADAINITPHGEVLLVGRPTCTVYRIDDSALVEIGDTIDDNETRGVHQLDSGAIVGVAGSGLIWVRGPDGTITTHDLADAGLSMPKNAQSMALDRRGRVWVGGHFSATVHEPDLQRRTRIAIAGEPKALAPHHGSQMYAAIYPSTEIVNIRADLTVESLGRIAHGQYRPREAVYHASSDQLLVAIGPSGGQLNGALTFVRPRTGSIDVYTGILPYQSVMSVHVEGDIAYICGDTHGEQNPPRERDTAQLAAVDVHSHRVLWRIEPMDLWASLEHVSVHDGLLYCVARRPRGEWFALDLGTMTIIRRGKVSGYGEIKSHNGIVYASTNFSDQISVLPGRTGDQRTLYDQIPIGWYNDPFLSFDRSTSALWSMWGKELARLPLS